MDGEEKLATNKIRKWKRTGPRKISMKGKKQRYPEQAKMAIIATCHRIILLCCFEWQLQLISLCRLMIAKRLGLRLRAMLNVKRMWSGCILLPYSVFPQCSFHFGRSWLYFLRFAPWRIYIACIFSHTT